MSCRQRHLLSSHNTAFYICVRGYQLFYIITWQLVCGDNKENLALSHLPTCMALSFLRKVFCMGLRYLLVMSIITCVSLLALWTNTCVSYLVWHYLCIITNIVYHYLCIITSKVWHYLAPCSRWQQRHSDGRSYISSLWLLPVGINCQDQTTSVIHKLIHYFSHPLVKISLRRHQAQMVKNGASSHKTTYIDIFSKILNRDGIEIAVLVQKLQRFCWMGGFCLLVELHREGSAPAACTAGLFSLMLKYLIWPVCVFQVLFIFGKFLLFTCHIISRPRQNQGCSTNSLVLNYLYRFLYILQKSLTKDLSSLCQLGQERGISRLQSMWLIQCNLTLIFIHIS